MARYLNTDSVSQVVASLNQSFTDGASWRCLTIA